MFKLTAKNTINNQDFFILDVLMVNFFMMISLNPSTFVESCELTGSLLERNDIIDLIITSNKGRAKMYI